MDVLKVDACTIEQKQNGTGPSRKRRLQGVLNKKSIILKSTDRHTVVCINLPTDTFDWCRIKRVYGKVPRFTGMYSGDVTINIDELNHRATVHAKCATDDDVWFTVLITLDVDHGSPKSDDSEEDADYDPNGNPKNEESSNDESSESSGEEEEASFSSGESGDDSDDDLEEGEEDSSEEDSSEEDSGEEDSGEEDSGEDSSEEEGGEKAAV